MWNLSGIAIAAVAAMTVASAAQATQVTVSTSTNQIQAGADNMGWWNDSFANNNSTNDNYITGYSNEGNYRSFFSFDLSGVGGVVTTATLFVRRYDQYSTVTLGLWDVSTPASELVTTRNGVFNPTIFADLGSGQSYGVTLVPVGVSQDILSFTLNAAALSDINAQVGLGYFSIGAALVGVGVVFSASNDEPGSHGGLNSIQNLVLEVSAIPEPQTLAMMLAGLGMLGLAVRSRTR